MPDHDIFDIAQDPTLWRSTFTQATQHQTLEHLLKRLEAAHRDAPENDFIRVRLSVLLRRAGQTERAFKLLAKRMTPLAIGQHALNQLDSSNATGISKAITLLSPSTTEISPEGLEGRIRLEAALGIAHRRLEQREEARAHFIRAAFIAELLQDNTLLALANRELAAVNERGEGELGFLYEAFKSALNANNPVELIGAAHMLADAAWEDEEYHLFLETIPYLKTGSDAQVGYAAFERILREGAIPTETPNVHFAATIAHAITNANLLLRARERYDHTEVERLRQVIFNLRLPHFSPAPAHHRLSLWKLVVWDMRDEEGFTEAWRKLTALLLTAPKPTRAAMHAIALEFAAHLKYANREHMEYHLSHLVQMFNGMNEQQVEISANALVIFAPHALSGLTSHFNHPKISGRLLSNAVVLPHKDALELAIGLKVMPAKQLAQHRGFITQEGSLAKVVIIRAVILEIKSLRLIPIPPLAVAF